MPVTNPKILQYAFLSGMYDDPYFPDALVDRAREVLLRLCASIEREMPVGIEALYVLTHAATEEINALESAFEDAGSEIETAARECFAEDFEFIASAYGFEADYEELIAPRNW
jgi:hypothetical protein